MKNLNWILGVTLFFVAFGCGDDGPSVGTNPSDPCDGANPPPSCQFEQNNDEPDMDTESGEDLGIDMEAECVPETEICDGEDNDCDGDVDEDFLLGEVCEEGDGACRNTGETICNDAGDAVICSATAGNPSDEEICDGNDNDCDGEIDEGFDTLGDACTSGVGACTAAGTLVCTGDGMDVECDAVAGTPAAMDLCDGIDNDCNGTVDDDFAADLGTACSVGVGACVNTGMNVCSDDQMSVVCDVMPLTPPEANEMTCDDIDNDCDGEVDEGCDDDEDRYCDDAMTTVGTPAVCPNGGGDCNDMVDVAFPGGSEICDTYDNDCNGTADDNASDAISYFLDCDSDGYAATANGSRVLCSPPGDNAANSSCGVSSGATWVTTLPSNPSNTDCEDYLADVNPGQTNYFDTAYNSGGGGTSFDYDCDGVATRQFPASGASTSDSCNPPVCSLLINLDCGPGGWTSTFPADCGVSATYTFCGAQSCGNLAIERECTGNRVTETRTQSCR